MDANLTIVEQIQQQIISLPPEKQSEVLDFIRFLQQRFVISEPSKRVSLTTHPAFGSWKEREMNSLLYEHNLRDEWDRS